MPPYGRQRFHLLLYGALLVSGSPLVLLPPSPPAMSAVVEKHSQKDQKAEPVVQVTTSAIGDEEDFPDGGLRAWLVVVGCFVVSSVTVSFWWVHSVHSPASQLICPFSSLVSVTLA